MPNMTWRKQPTGKAMQALRQRGDSISMPLRYTTKWQNMPEEDIIESMRTERCSEKMIAQQMKWLREIRGDDDNSRADAKKRRHIQMDMQDEELIEYVTDVSERRKIRFDNILEKVKDSLNAKNRMGHLVKPKKEGEVDEDTVGEDNISS